MKIHLDFYLSWNVFALLLVSNIISGLLFVNTLLLLENTALSIRDNSDGGMALALNNLTSKSQKKGSDIVDCWTYWCTLLLEVSLDSRLDDGIAVLGIGDFAVWLVDRLINDVARRWRWRRWWASVKGGLGVYHQDRKDHYQLEWKGF